MTRLASSVPGSVLGVVAFAAFPREPFCPTSLGAGNQVVTGVGVPLGTVGLCASPSGVAAADILRVRHRLEMRWVDAATSTAEVIERQAGRNRANELLVAEPVRLDQPPSSEILLAKPEAPVPVAVPEGASPQPAPRVGLERNLRPETRRQPVVVKHLRPMYAANAAREV